MMPRPDQGTRQKLIDTASELIWRSSYGAVSVDDICRHAGVKKGSFYHYFPSKQDLAITAMEEYYSCNVAPRLEQVYAANATLEQRLNLLADMILETQRSIQAQYGAVCGCPLAALGCEMVGQEDRVIIDKMKEMFERCKVQMRAMIAHAVEDGVIEPTDPVAKTEEIHDFITGLKMMARINNSLEGLERDLKPGLMRIVGLPYNHNQHQNQHNNNQRQGKAR